MTALLIDQIVTPGVSARVSRRRTPARRQGRPTLGLVAAPDVLARPVSIAPAVPGRRPAAPAASVRSAVPERLYWTPRGLAVALALVALVTGLMVATLVVGFLAVSNEPVGATRGAAGQLVAAPAAPGSTLA